MFVLSLSVFSVRFFLPLSSFCLSDTHLLPLSSIRACVEFTSVWSLACQRACAFRAQNVQKPPVIEKPARKVLEFNCSLLILLKHLSCVADLVTAHVKCSSWFSGCRLSHRSDGVLGKDHNSWGQGTTRLLWLQWWWQESSYHGQWVSFWPHSYFCKYQMLNGCWRNMCSLN